MIPSQFSQSIDLHFEAFQLERTIREFLHHFTRRFHGDSGKDDASARSEQRFTSIQNLMHISGRPADDDHIHLRQPFHRLRRCAGYGMDIPAAELFRIFPDQLDPLRISFYRIHSPLGAAERCLDG